MSDSKDKCVVVFNCGSSSLSYKVYKITGPGAAPLTLACGKAHRVGCSGTSKPFLEHKRADGTQLTVDHTPENVVSHATAAAAVIRAMAALHSLTPSAVGHRFVHGGELFTGPVLIQGDVYDRLKRCLPLAPIHNPISLSVIDECFKVVANVPQFVVFDTAFHANIEPKAYTYALPTEIVQKYGYRKYGFHGLSYQFVTDALSSVTDIKSTKLVAAHLGTGGSSVAAISAGKSVDTSMGWSPLPGLVMSTRTGDIDASVPLSLIAEHGFSPADVNAMFNNKSGLHGLTGGLTSDLRDVYAIASQPGNVNAAKCKLTFDVYVHRLVGMMCQCAGAMDGVNAIAFTDDLGFDMPVLRAVVCERLQWLGVEIDQELNAKATRANGGVLNANHDVALISTPGSKVKVFVVVNDEEVIIVKQGSHLLFNSKQ